MAKAKIGKLPKKYKFILNKYPDERLSTCPMCKKPTHPRKFALFIDIDEWGPMAMGKTTKYCSKCELIIVHQHELESELAYAFSKIAPEMVGNDYWVIGTIEKKVWQKGLNEKGTEIREVLSHVADFKKVYDLEVQPAGWYRSDAK